LRRLIAVLLAALLLILGATPALAKRDRDDLEKERQDNLSRLTELGNQLEDVSKDLSNAFMKLERTKAELPTAQAKVADANAAYTRAKGEYDAVTARLTKAEGERDELQDDIATSEQRVAEAKLALGELARQTMLQTGPAETDLMLLLGATDLEELDATYMAAEAAARHRAALLRSAQDEAAQSRNREARMQAVADEIADLQTQAVTALEEADGARTAAERAKVDLDSLVATQAEQADELEHQKLTIEQQENELQAANATIAADLKRLAEEEKANAVDGGPPITPGQFGSPLASLSVSSPFGWRIHPILGTRRLHTGADLSAACGTPIYATADGVVISTYYQSAWGNRTEINHGVYGGHSIVSTYNHQRDGGFAVGPQDHVTKGQLIGYVGTTGWSTGCHLHFEIYSDGEPVDPMPYL
jgi:murein DD-endopeptidase MepM/ murein hydrolase activator NlpD